ncbi:MAG: hypothetical protein D6737_05530 [Chloroflexi bacterium]|nr:MAG: hypothetical protein D6737_05530 [Chloroflexota bacterium]
MATMDTPVEVKSGQREPRTRAAYAIGGLRFDIIMILLSTWFVTGVYLDGWAHNNISNLIDDFFTPWHGVLYSGYFAVAGFTVLTLYRNVSKGYAFGRALPRGYLLSLLGVVIFFFAGGGDFVWHEIFGFEENIEALLSPTHLLLVLGGLLFVSGPLRAAWHRPNAETDTSWRGLFPVVLSLLLVYSLVTFIMQFGSIVTFPNVLAGSVRHGSPDFVRSVVAINDLLIQSAMITGLLLVALRRWHLPFGAITAILTINTLAMHLMDWDDSQGFWGLVIAALLTGLIADVARHQLRPSLERVNVLRAWAFVLPFMLTLFYILAIIYHEGVIWRIHMTLGTPVMAGFVGLGLSFVLAPPAVPTE